MVWILVILLVLLGVAATVGIWWAYGDVPFIGPYLSFVLSRDLWEMLGNLIGGLLRKD